MPGSYRSAHVGAVPGGELCKSKLSPARQKLIDLLRAIDFGRVCNVWVVKGQPVLGKDLVITRTVKLAGTPTSRPRPAKSPDLEPAQVELLGQLDRIGNGFIRRIEVALGLPLFMEIEEAGTALAEGEVR